MRFFWSHAPQQATPARARSRPLRLTELEDRTVPAGGDYGFTLHLNSTDEAEGQRVVARDGFVYVTGYFTGTVDFDPSETSSLLSTDNTMVFVAKYTDAGALVWARSFQGDNYATGYGLAVDGLGNVYTTGEFIGTVDFDPGAGVAQLSTTNFGNTFISKLDSRGHYVWAKNLASTSRNIGWMVAVDEQQHVYTVGQFQGTADFDPHPHPESGLDLRTSTSSLDIYLSKLDSDGNHVWAQTIGGTGSDIGYGLAIGASGVYTIGGFAETVDFNPDPHPVTGVANLTSHGSSDIFVSKFDHDGQYQWAKNFGGTGADLGWSIALDDAENVAITGEFRGTADFDPSAGIAHLTSLGGSDIFVGKLTTHGDYLWAKSIGGANSENAFDLAVDAEGSVYTTGYFRGTVDFDPNVEIANLTSHGQEDVFVSKLNANGDYVWAKNVGGNAMDFGFGLAVDDHGNVFHTGYFQGTADFDPDIGYVNFHSGGGNDIFVNKLLGDDVGQGGEITFQTQEYHGAEGSSITVTVERRNGSSGAVSVNYTTLDQGRAAAWVDYTPTSGSLTWEDGDATPKTFTITTLDDDILELQENIPVALYHATGNAIVGDWSRVNVQIAPSDGTPLGSFTDSDGDLGKITLTGGGTGRYYLDDPDGDGRGDLALIELDGTNSRSSVLTISVKKPATVTGDDAGRISLGTIAAPALKSLNAPQVNVLGSGINIAGHLSTLTVGDVLNGADIITGVGLTTQSTTITAKRIGHGTTINTGARLASLSAIDVGAGTIIAPSIGRIVTRGQATPEVAGDFGSTVTVSGVGLATNAIALGAMSIAGSLLDGATISAPSVGKITVRGNMSGDVSISGLGLTPAPSRFALHTLNVLGRLTADIQVGGAIASVSALEFPSGLVNATRLVSLRTVGRKATTLLPAVTGDLGATITLTGLGLAANVPALVTWTIAGTVLDSTTITAPSMGTLTVRGNFLGDVTLSGVGMAATRHTLGQLLVSGAVTNSNVLVAGHVGTLRAGSFVNSRLFAGYTGSDDASGTFTGNGTITTFTTTATADSFVGSHVIGEKIGTVTLKSLKPINGQTFGVTSNTTIKQVRSLDPVFVYTPTNTTLNDFAVRIV